MNQTFLTKLTLVLIVFCCFNEITLGQCEPVFVDNMSMSITPNTEDGSHSFNIPHEEGDLIIWFFGDGHYATGTNPSHTYQDSGPHKVTAYKASGYVPDPPSLFRGKTEPNGPTGLAVNNYLTTGSIFEGINASLNSSWNITPVTNNFHYFIITLRNTTAESFSGSVTLWSDSDISFATGDCFLPEIVNNEDWYENVTAESTSGLIDVSLEAGEVKQFYVLSNLDTDFNFHEQPFIESFLELNSLDGKAIGFVSLNSHITLYPHDPNSISVLQDHICPLVDVTQVLDKIVHFQNIGYNYADTVGIIIFDNSYQETHSMVVIDASHEVSVVESNGAFNKILFYDIDLPGLNQTSPGQFTSSETTGWVHLQFTVKPCVDTDDEINSEAFIQFVGVGGLWTNEYNTIIDRQKCSDLPLCEDDDDGDDDVGDAKNDFADSGIFGQFRIQPNPFQSQFYLDIPAVDSQISIKVIDMQGLEVHQENLLKGDAIIHAINSDSWQDGIYLIYIYYAKGSKVIKCIKQG